MSIVKTTSLSERNRKQVRPSLLSAIARRGLIAKFKQLREGQITLVEGKQRWQFGSPSENFPVSVRIDVHNSQSYPDVAFGGSIGAGESYMQGYWHCSDLTGLSRILLRNREVLDSLESGTGKLALPLHRLFHFWHRNSLHGSKRNIKAHYDLGNDFFQQFLDPSMMYSCGIFKGPETTLEQASIAKLDRICQKLQLSPTDHVLEIGTGWGGFAIHAASHYGCQVTTTTISDQQYALAKQRIADAGLSDRIHLLKKDFRELDGQFDKLVSIEMIEAVGEANLNRFFQVCRDRLRPEGEMLLQAITIADHLYDSYRGTVDFIQRYIFPGGFLPCLTALDQKITQTGQLEISEIDEIGPHYATTLNHWRQNLHANLGTIKSLGYSDELIRMWEFYLGYCESGFIERTLGTVQMTLVKSD